MAKRTNREFAIALYEATKGLKGKELESMINSFAHFLFRNGVVKQTATIIKEFVSYSKKQDGVIDLEVVSARPLTGKLISEIKKSFGETVEINEKIDEELIGGVKIKTENMIFDGSLKKQLQILKQNIN